jgi:hypothetical protein
MMSVFPLWFWFLAGGDAFLLGCFWLAGRP